MCPRGGFNDQLVMKHVQHASTQTSWPVQVLAAMHQLRRALHSQVVDHKPPDVCTVAAATDVLLLFAVVLTSPRMPAGGTPATTTPQPWLALACCPCQLHLQRCCGLEVRAVG
jgi:hypothetical protein